MRILFGCAKDFAAHILGRCVSLHLKLPKIEQDWWELGGTDCWKVLPA